MVFKSRRNVCRILFFVFTLSLIMCSFTSLTAVGADSKTDTLEPVNLKWYVAGEGDQPDTSLVEDAVDKYLKNKINATVTIKTFGWGEYNEKMAVLFAAGEPFDMCFTSSWAAYYSPYSLVGAFKDLTDMMDTYAPKTKAFLGSTVLKGAEVNGRLYAIPNYQKNIACSYGIVLNKNLAQKYKVDVSKIKKLQDLEPIFKNVKAKAPNVIDFYPMDSTENNSVFVTLNNDELAGYRLPGAVQMNGNSTKVINQYDTPQAKTIFALMNKWYKQGYISKSSKDSGFFEKNKDNILAFYSTLDPFIKEDLANFNDLEVLPVELNKPFISTSSITFSLTAIPTTSKNPERALMFLELLNTDEKLANMINFGIEGTHYKKAGAKTITELPAAENYMPCIDLSGNGSLLYQRSGYKLNDWNKVKENINRAIPSPLLGFNFNSQYVADELSSLEEIVNKYYIDLSIGKIDPAVNLPKMNKEFKNAGLQKVLNEIQKQVDTFVKAQKN